MGNCCTFFKSELNPCQEYFSSTDPNGKQLDIEESFGPSSIYAILAKVAFAGFTIFTWISTFLASDHKEFFLAYLTLWALSFQIVYHVFSVWNSLSPPPGINRRVKIHWYLFNMVVHCLRPRRIINVQQGGTSCRNGLGDSPGGFDCQSHSHPNTSLVEGRVSN